MTNLKRADIVAVTLPVSENGSHMITRYAVVVSADVINENLQTVIVCPLIKADSVSQSRVGATFIPKEATGLDLDSLAVSLRIKTIAKNRINKRVGSIPVDLMDEISESMQAVLDIN